MAKALLTLIILITSSGAGAQRPQPDIFSTSAGQLSIQPILHASIVFTWNNKAIYIDPSGGAKAYQGLPSPDLILITDIHQDHLNTETLDALETSDATFIVPQAVADKLQEKYKKKMVILNNGDDTEQLDIGITAMPMYNLPESPDSRHTKGRGNGYLLRLGGKSIYISGDTEDIPEMRHLKNIDIAFVCMNLPYTMSIDQAASAVLSFQPKIVYPFHYRGQDGMSDTRAFKKLVNDVNPAIVVRLRNWYPEFR